MAVVQPLHPGALARMHPGERWDINGILSHVAGAEWWYQERIGHPFPTLEEDLPADLLASLAMVRRHFVEMLPKFQGSTRVIGLDGELWSPRQVLRRAAWHERDHTQHILKLL